MSDLAKTPDDMTESALWFRVELHSQGRTCRLALSGGLCDTSIAALEAQVDQLGCIPCDDVEVDVRRLTALDSVGANVLLGLHHYVDGRGGRLRITGATGTIAETLRQYLLEYTEADEHMMRALGGGPSPTKAD
jgi:anti-anti-sigma regulatory factor